MAIMLLCDGKLPSRRASWRAGGMGEHGKSGALVPMAV